MIGYLRNHDNGNLHLHTISCVIMRFHIIMQLLPHPHPVYVAIIAVKCIDTILQSHIYVYITSM